MLQDDGCARCCLLLHLPQQLAIRCRWIWRWRSVSRPGLGFEFLVRAMFKRMQPLQHIIMMLLMLLLLRILHVLLLLHDAAGWLCCCRNCFSLF